jgi:hypothetical protein
MQIICNSIFQGDKEFKLESKVFYHEGNIFKNCKKIMENHEKGQISYQIDGLIFTPKSLPVGAIYMDSQPKLNGAWNKAFKWKPPKDNSIDFLVKTEKNKAGGDVIISDKDGVVHKVLKLYVSYDVITSDKITPSKYLSLIADPKQLQKTHRRQRRLFEPIEDKKLSDAFVPIDKNNLMRCSNNDIVLEDMVVEFTHEKGRWIPLRVRHDKKEGNSYNTATNVWNSMQTPVTREMIEGSVKVEDATIDEEDDIYYNRIEERDKSVSKPMLDFHNQWVKNVCLIGKFRGKATYVVDFACGKGGDVPKYLKNGFKTVIGFDKSVENIVDPHDGAYRRILRNVERGWSKDVGTQKIAFLPLDVSKLIDDDNIESIKDESTRRFAKVLYGQIDDKQVETFEKPYSGIVRPHIADVVSCQFAIHYFFESEKTLDHFIQNVDGILKVGGYFIGTCLDGRRVDDNFNKPVKTDVLEGKTTGRTLWRLEKEYKEMSGDNENNFNLKIKVFMETINKPFVEYLVDFNLLVERLRKYNITPLTKKECELFHISHPSSGLFKGLYADMENSGMDTWFTQSAKLMTAEQKTYSFMNRWFVFKKRASS